MVGEITGVLLVTALMAVSPGATMRCDRTPEIKTYPQSKLENKFEIQISGNPDTYVPEEQRTIILSGRKDRFSQYKFKDFLLVVEPENVDARLEITQRPSVGSFTLFGDALTRYSDKCRNAVKQTNSLPKREIQVLWKAPEAGSGCVAFRATVVEERDRWYMDEGNLTKVLCEEVNESEDMQPPILQKCCACEEAKYEVTFEGLWSRNTHPKDFPQNNWITKFSDVIGASHTKNYTFWNYGELASNGLRQVAEQGNTRILESELKRKSDHIRTIIKARGISYPNVTGKTFAVFRVDSQHHLMSLVSMISPSPDWFVGVSSLELCLRNCSWVESKILNLYPNDAGTDDGWTYVGDDKPTTPRQAIRRIKSDSPNDPRSPFYDPTGAEMKPFARLYLSRQRLYEKPCEDTNEENDGGSKPDCEVTIWSEWSACSATCGRGTKYRQRKYVKESSRYECTRKLTSRASCEAPISVCPEHNDDKSNDPMCALSDWSPWSSCSVSCGIGHRTRDRHFQSRNATKHCSVGRRNRPKLQDTERCIGHYGSCDGKPLDLSRLNSTPNCAWTLWTPCSATCGRGYKFRQREHYYSDEVDATFEEGEDDPCDNEEEKEVVQCEIQPCDTVNTSEVTRDPITSMQIGSLIVDPEIVEHEPGPIIDCEISAWSPWSECNVKGKCGKGTKSKHRNILTHPMNGGRACPKRLLKYKNCRISCNPNKKKDDLNPTWGSPLPESQDCEMSAWSQWTSCTASCGSESVRIRTRQILREPTGGGRPCGSKVDRQKCNMPSCFAYYP